MVKKKVNKTLLKLELKKASKVRSITKELMQKAVRHIASERLATKPDANGRTP
jgi:hypothetical protein